MSDTDIVTKLQLMLHEHDQDRWRQLLLDSIVEARNLAIEEKVAGAEDYPTELEGDNGYYAYLNKMVKWTPREDVANEVLNHLCKFYWLLDQPGGKKLQESDQFNDWMREFANDWGSYLNTPESASGIQTFIDDDAFNAWQYMQPPSGWLTFNQFFGREIKPGLRPVAGIRSDKIIVSPADSTFKKKFKIGRDDEVTIKLTHKYKITDLLKDSPYADKFVGGLFWHAFLGPNDYHRFHAPVRGTVLECRAIQAKVYLQVVIKEGKFHGEFSAPDEAGYEFTQTRGLIVFDSPVGLVAVLPIGMAQVSSVNMTAVEGAFLNKGDEFGYFLFGGSDIIMLFQPRRVEMTAAPGIHYNANMAVGEIM